MKATCAGCGHWGSLDDGLCFLCRDVRARSPQRVEPPRRVTKPRRPQGEGFGSCATCGRQTPHPDYRACALHDRDPDPVVCLCADPVVDGLGECRSCHRKPARMLGVIGREALVATGARVTSPAAVGAGARVAL